MSDIENQARNSRETKSYRWAWLFSVIAALNCITAVLVFASYNTSNFNEGFMTQWPFPMIYFIEIIIIGIIGIIAMGKIQWQEKSSWSAAFWICSGILFSFVILGAWTIGFFLLPAMVIYLLLGIFIDKRTGNEIPRHLVFFVSGGIAQAVSVFLTLI